MRKWIWKESLKNSDDEKKRYFPPDRLFCHPPCIVLLSIKSMVPIYRLLRGMSFYCRNAGIRGQLLCAKSVLDLHQIKFHKRFTRRQSTG